MSGRSTTPKQPGSQEQHGDRLPTLTEASTAAARAAMTVTAHVKNNLYRIGAAPQWVYYPEVVPAAAEQVGPIAGSVAVLDRYQAITDTVGHLAQQAIGVAEYPRPQAQSEAWIGEQVAGLDEEYRDLLSSSSGAVAEANRAVAAAHQQMPVASQEFVNG